MQRTGGAVLASAAFGFLAGLAANPARKLVVQGAEATVGDWVAELTSEHRSVEKALDALLATHDRETAKRQGLLLRIVYLLNKHAIEEENVVYPAVRKHNPGAAGELVADHAEIKSLVSELKYGFDKEDPRWLSTARSLRDRLASHARQEEEQVFPLLRAGLSEQENTALTRRLNREGLRLA
jgi:hemerythrin superfamily protein